MKTICVLGAKGRLAREVVGAFDQAGWQVIAISRNGEIDGLPAGVEQRAADAMDEAALVRACDGADFIFNGLNPPYTKWKSFVLPMARNVITAAKATGAVHLMPGNVYNFGNQLPAVLNEKTPFVRNTIKGGIRIDMEALFEQAANNGVKTLILRAGDFFGGQGRGSWFDLAITSKLEKGVFTYPGPLDQPHAWAYLPDLAQAFVLTAKISDELATFEQFTYGGITMTGAELKGFCEALVGRKLTHKAMPWAMIKLGGLVVPMWREIAEMSYLWHRAHQLDGARVETVLAGPAMTPAVAAVRQALVDLGIKPHQQVETKAEVDAGIA